MLLVTGESASSNRAFASRRSVFPLWLTVSLPILAGAYPPVASNPSLPVPQNVSRTPPAAPVLREISSSNAPTELLVGMYAPTHGVSSTPPCAAAGVAAAEITARAVTEPASVPISFRIDIPTPYQKLLWTQTGRWLSRAVRATGLFRSDHDAWE